VDKQESLKQMFVQGAVNSSVVDMMHDTYCLQRLAVNDGETVENLIKAWFCFPQLLQFLSESDRKDVRHGRVELLVARKVAKSSLPDVLGVLHLMAAYFGENLKSIFVVRDVSFILLLKSFFYLYYCQMYQLCCLCLK